MSADTPRSLEEIIAAKKAQDENAAKRAADNAAIKLRDDDLWAKASAKFQADYVSTIGIADRLNESLLGVKCALDVGRMTPSNLPRGSMFSIDFIIDARRTASGIKFQLSSANYLMTPTINHDYKKIVLPHTDVHTATSDFYEKAIMLLLDKAIPR